MEEAPKIERVVASQGISISDTAKILTSYLSKVNHHHHHQSINFNDTSKDDNTNLNDNGDDANNKSPIRKSKQEREEDALIAQMDQLANSKSSGMISDDIYERLKTITESITAEVEGRTISACGLDKNNKEQNEGSDDNVNGTTDDVANDFRAGLEQLDKQNKQQQEQIQVKQPQQQQTDTTPKSHREKKKAKKDKKAAKKAKKEAKHLLITTNNLSK